MLWAAAIADWVTWLMISGAPKTTQKTRGDHVALIARRTGSAAPHEVTLAMLVRVCSAQRWSREYRRGMRRSLIAFFDWAVDNRLADHNPAEKMPRVPCGSPNPRPVPDDLWRELLDTAPPRERLMIKLAGQIGLRRAEVAQIRREDLIRDGEGWVLLVTGKGDKQRGVPVHDTLAQEIRAYNMGGYLFPGGDDGHLTPRAVGIMVSELMPDGWTMHKLRHRYATRGLNGTGNMMLVKDALGHASVATTQVYTKVAREQLRSLAEIAQEDD